MPSNIDAEDERPALERARFLRRSADMDVTRKQAHALALREMGYTHAPIARELGSTETTVKGWLHRFAARYGLSAIETKWEEQRGDLSVMTVERLAGYSHGVRADYREIAESYREVVPEPVAEELGLDEDDAGGGGVTRQ